LIRREEVSKRSRIHTPPWPIRKMRFARFREEQISEKLGKVLKNIQIRDGVPRTRLKSLATPPSTHAERRGNGTDKTGIAT